MDDALRYIAGVAKGAAKTTPAAAERTIKRYGNRKLYDPEAGRYVTLDDLARMVGDGEEVRVVDQRSGDDLTTVVLAQVLLEGLKQRTARIPREVLVRLIRIGFGSLARWGRSLAPPEAVARARHEVERIVSGLLRRGKLSLDEALSLRQELGRTVQRSVAEAQKGLEARLHGLLDRSAKDGDVGPVLRSLKGRLLSLDTYLGDEGRRSRWPHGRRREAPREARTPVSGSETPGRRR